MGRCCGPRSHGHTAPLLAVLILLSVALVAFMPSEAQALDPPAAPRGLEAVPGDGRVSLSWEEPEAAGVYKIDYYAVYQDGVDVKHSAKGSTSAVVAGLTNGRAYSFAVAAHNKEGVGERTSAVTVTPRISTTVPGAPMNLQAAAGDAGVFLSWTAPSNDGGMGIDYYVVFQDGEDVLHPSGTTASLSGLMNGRSYEFAVAAHSSAGIGPRSNLVTAAPSAPSALALAPNAPTDLMASPGERAVALSWTAPDGDTDIDYYIVFQDGVDVMHVAGTSATISGLTNGVTYTFKVAAHSPGGTGPSSVPQGITLSGAAVGSNINDSTVLTIGILIPIGVVGAVALLLMNRTRTRRFD